MWYDFFEENTFARSLFVDNSSELQGSLIDLYLDLYSNHIRMQVQTKAFLDSPPKKWGGCGEYSLLIVLDFYNIYDFRVNRIQHEECCFSFKLHNGLLCVNLYDTTNLCFLCECGVIQSIKYVSDV